MRLSEFKKLLKRATRGIELRIPLEELYVYRSYYNKSIKLVDDDRSFKKDGVWHVQPLAVEGGLMYIVCPFCHEIHLHCKDKEDREAFRRSHCNDRNGRTYYNIINIKEKER